MGWLRFPGIAGWQAEVCNTHICDAEYSKWTQRFLAFWETHENNPTDSGLRRSCGRCRL